MTRTRWIPVGAWASVPLVGVLVTVSTYYWKLSYELGRTTDRPGLFSARLREEVDINTLAAELQAVVTRTMQPDYVSLWIREKS